MKSSSVSAAFSRGLPVLWKLILYCLAAAGFIWLAGGTIGRILLSPMFVTEKVRVLPSPNGDAVAEIEVRSGGLATVWTTRVHLRPDPDNDFYWTVYQAKDSDFVPPMRWVDNQTLLITLPCKRFDYASNPDDWQRSDSSERRLKVRFTYPAACSSR
jgi:hypothetical protein